MNWRKKLGTVLCLLLFSAIQLMVLPPKVSAIASDPNWIANYVAQGNQVSIFTTGNGLAEKSLPLSTSRASNNLIYYEFNNDVLYGANKLKNKNNTSEQCYVHLTIVVASDTPGNGRAYLKSFATADQKDKRVACDSKVVSEAQGKFDQKDITIGHTDVFAQILGQSSAELAEFKAVSVTVTPLIDAGPSDEIDVAKVAQNDTVTIKTLADVEVVKKQSDNVQVTGPPSSSVYYLVKFNPVEPGDYKVCSDLVKKCTAFTKEKNVVPNVAIKGGDDTKQSVKKGQAGNTGGDQNPTCETSGNPLSWILCPVFNGVADASDYIFRNIVQPFLVAPPISTNPKDDTFKIWSSFRVYGNIFLIIAMLVIVFGQAIGGGLVDAYTAKKVLPRLLVAAILINLSVYVVALLVDLTNIVGNGIGNLLIAPIKGAGAFNFSPNGVQSVGVFSVGILGSILAGGSVAGMLGALLFHTGAALQATLFVGFFILLPILLAILGVFVTLIIRRGLILFLILISPVAFALYALPNTEQYFRKWWKLLFETLMVYPIVIVIFAIADIMSITILRANNIDASGLSTSTLANGAGNIIAVIIAFILQFLPLVLIPFAFRFAGGAIASLHGALTNGAGRIHKMTESRKEREKQKLHRLGIQSRVRQYGALGEAGDRASGLRRRGLRFLQNRMGGYDLFGEHSRITAEQLKEAEATKDTGIDDELRGLTVNKQWALAHDARGGTHWRMENGRRQFRTLGGRWVDEANVDAAHQRWDGNEGQLQWSIGYEMQKAATQEEMDYLYQNYGRINGAGSGFNMSDGELNGLWTGAAFAKQNTDRQYKHYTWSNGALRANGLNLMREIDERQGNYAMSQQSADTWTTMSEEYERAQDTLARAAAGQATQEETNYANEVTQRARRIAAQFATQMPYGYSATGGVAGMGPEGQPIPAQPQPGASQTASGDWVVSPTGGPARTQEEIGNFVRRVLPQVQERDAPGYNRDEGLPRRAGPNPPGDIQRPGRTRP